MLCAAMGEEPVSKVEDGAADGEEEAEPAPPPGAGTPEGERLAEAFAAFEVGDYRRVREVCDALVEAPQEDVARAARELRARTEVDPVQIGVLLACLALFVILAYMYVL